MASTSSLPLASASIAAALLVYLLLSRSRRAPIAPIVLPPKEAANGVLRDFVVERVLRRRGALHIFETLPPKHTALVIIDMQHTFLDAGAAVEVPLARGTVGNINALARAVRDRGGRVVWIAHANTVLGAGDNDWAAFRCHFVSGVHRKRYVESLSPGARGQRIWSELMVDKADIVLQKNRYSALIGGSSQLERVLRSADLTTVLLAGCKTDVCVESTGRDAMMLDFGAVIVEDCCAALTHEEHRDACETFVQQFGDVMSSAEVVAALDRGAADCSVTRPRSAIA